MLVQVCVVATDVREDFRRYSQQNSSYTNFFHTSFVEDYLVTDTV